MKIKESFIYPDTDVESVYSLIIDPAFREEAAADAGGVDIDITVEPSGDGHTATIVRSQPAEMPDFVKKFTGDTVKVKQTEKWGAAGDGGGRHADVKLSIIGQPAEMLGTVELTADGSDVSFVITGDVKVNIPFLGKKIEPEIAKAVKASISNDVKLGKKRL